MQCARCSKRIAKEIEKNFIGFTAFFFAWMVVFEKTIKKYHFQAAVQK